MKNLLKSIKNEKGVTIIESVLLLALFGTIFVVLAPSIKQMFVGTPKNPGMATYAIQHQISGLNEVNTKNVELIPGCQVGGSITSEKCAELH